MKPTKPLTFQSEWTFALLRQYNEALADMARAYGLDIYPFQVEMINAEQMMDAYAATGLPLIYNHWSFGRQFIELEKRYRQGKIDLAYEIVINANPCRAYMIAESSLTMQVIVLAHACYGHNAFFKNNACFNYWADPENILDYLLSAKAKITAFETRYGVSAVEHLIDACHALRHYGVFHVKRPHHEQTKQTHDALTPFPAQPDENILYFIEQHATHLQPWQREIIAIIRTLAQYFYPQRLTKVMNEGWASFWHYTLVQSLYDDGWLTDEFMLQFIQYHCQVIHQPAYDSPQYNGINPYTLGFKLFSDIKRYSENPTDEDRAWFGAQSQTPWLQALDFAMRNFKDDSFITQHLSPHLMRDLKLFTVRDDAKQNELEISDIHDAQGYHHIRQTLANQYNPSLCEPQLHIYHVDTEGDNSLTLRHTPHQERPLSAQNDAMLRILHQLWGHPVHIESVTEAGSVLAHHSYPARSDNVKS